MTFFQTYFPPVYCVDGKVNVRLTIHYVLFFVLLFLLAAAQPVSKFMMSGMEILLAVNWILMLMGNLVDRRKTISAADTSGRWLLFAFMALMAVHLIWMLPSANRAYGWDDIFRKLPLIAIPLVVLTSRPLNRNQLSVVFAGFVLSVFVATIIGRVRMLTMNDLPYRQIIPFISHIRFSMNVCMALVLMVWFAVERARRGIRLSRDILFWILAIVALSLLDFLFRLRSYTAFVMLFVVAVVLLAVYGRRIRSRLLSVSLWALMAAAVVGSVALSVCMARSYYKPCPLASEPLRACTVNGNPYRHSGDGLMENGNYVNNYICREELDREWSKRSAMSIADTTVNGYAVYPTLLRYLNALGTTKDSVGVSMLTDEDVAAIEKGIANPVYMHGSAIRNMYYVMFYEYESYRKLHVVKDFTMLQRFELWKTAWRVFSGNPLFGVGTGDVVDECHRQLVIDGSPLQGTTKHTHNQYLTFLVTFGLVGFLLIVAVFVYALRRERLLRLPAATAYIVILLVSFITEDTLETLAGCVFSVMMFCLLMRSISSLVESEK